MHREHVVPVVDDPAFGFRNEAQQQASDGRLTRAGFADEPERLAPADRETDAVDRAHVGDVARRQAGVDRKVFVEFFDFEQRCGVVHRAVTSGTVGASMVRWSLARSS